MRQHSKSSLFLMELIISILFFALASAICIQLFVYAHTKTQQSQEISLSMTQCESAAELYRAANGNLSALAVPLHGKISNGSMLCMFDRNGNFGADQSDYLMELHQAETDGLSTLLIQVYSLKNENEMENIYSLTIQVHPPYIAQKGGQSL